IYLHLRLSCYIICSKVYSTLNKQCFFVTLFNIEYTILNFKEGGIIMKNILIQSKNLKKQFNARTVINDVSFNIYEKEILAIIGPNGAGKTTLIEMILGLK